MEEKSRTLGVQEERDLKKFLKFLSQKVYSCACFVFINFSHLSLKTCRFTGLIIT